MSTGDASPLGTTGTTTDVGATTAQASPLTSYGEITTENEVSQSRGNKFRYSILAIPIVSLFI